MASVKVKFRPSTVNGKEGTLYYQVIHNRVVRQINTEYNFCFGMGQPFRNGCLASSIDRTREEQLPAFNRFTHQVGQGQAEQNHTQVISIRHIRNG